jgi:LacI family transcriptional regulator
MVPPYDSYWADVIHGIHDELIDHDYVPLALWSRHRTPQNDEAHELRQIERLVDWRVDGAILWPWFANFYHTHINDLKKRGLPLVTIDSVLPDSFSADAVLSDETQGAEAIAAHLLALGHRQILHFAGPAHESWSRERRRSFTEALAKTPDATLHVVELPFTTPRRELIREALTGLPQVTAVFCATDGVAEEVYGVAAEMGVSIPGNLSVVGYGNVDFSSRLNPPLTTVAHSPYRMGKAAARLVIRRIEAPVANPSQTDMLPVEFVPRASTGPVTR